MTLRSKLENIWYHYKFHIIIGLFLLITLIICLHSCVVKPRYDIQVFYVAGSSPMYNEQLAWLESAVAAHCGDLNGDGEVTVSVSGVRVGDSTDATQRVQDLNAVQAGDAMLLFGDEGGINYLYQHGYLQPLNDFTKDTVGEGYAWSVTGSSFSTQTDGFDVFSQDLYLSLRIFDNSWSSLRPGAETNYERACNTLRSIIDAQ